MILLANSNPGRPTGQQAAHTTAHVDAGGPHAGHVHVAGWCGRWNLQLRRAGRPHISLMQGCVEGGGQPLGERPVVGPMDGGAVGAVTAVAVAL